MLCVACRMTRLPTCPSIASGNAVFSALTTPALLLRCKHCLYLQVLPCLDAEHCIYVHKRQSYHTAQVQLLCDMQDDPPTHMSFNSLREYSDPSMDHSRPAAAYSAATTPANSVRSTPNHTPKHAGGRATDAEDGSDSAHLRRQDSGRRTRFQREIPAGNTSNHTSTSRPNDICLFCPALDSDRLHDMMRQFAQFTRECQVACFPMQDQERHSGPPILMGAEAIQ